MSASNSLPRTWLEQLIDVVEVGGWRSALQLGMVPPADVQPATARLTVVLRLVALGMQAQADGDVGLARDRLGQAAQGLPIISRRLTREREWLAVSLPPPPDRSGLPFLNWRVSVVVVREQEELAELYALVREHPDAVDVLLEAFTYWRMWVDEDRDTWRPGGEEGVRDIDPSQHALCRRATRLRRAVLSTTPTVDSRAWRRANGYHGIRVEAAQRLSRRALVPWTAQVRVRPARQRVWEAAQDSAD